MGEVRKGNIESAGERMRKQILGVNIDDITIDQAVQIVASWLYKGGKRFIVTTNPEFIVTAEEDLLFKKILNKADLSIPDGAGLKLSGKIKNTFPGVDFMEKLIELVAEKAFTVGFLGGRGQVAERTVERLKKKYPALNVKFVSEEPDDIPKLDILFVAFGHPKQEYWIYENLPKLNVGVAMGVGGSFDFLSGKVPRAPLWVRKIRMEWLFRLIIQPRRIKRQRRLFKYVTLILWQRFSA